MELVVPTAAFLLLQAAAGTAWLNATVPDARRRRLASKLGGATLLCVAGALLSPHLLSRRLWTVRTAYPN